MRVLHVITGLAAGGAENQLRLLLQHTRHDAEVICLYNAGSVAAGLRVDGVAVTDLGMPSNKDVGAVVRLAGLMRRGRFDVVHTHLYRACLYGRVAARLAGVPRIVATEHSLLDDQLEGRQATRAVRTLYRTGERLGDVTIAVSDAVRSNLLAWGLAPERLVRIPNGLQLEDLAFDPDRRRETRAALDIPADAQVIGAVGRLHPGKRFDELLRSVAPTLGPQRRLVVVGAGSERAALHDLAATLGVADALHLPGEQPVAPYLSAMDVLVSPSPYETFGLAVLEGLANGLPVAYRRCPALDELGPVPSAHAIAPHDDLLTVVDRLLDAAPGERACPPALQELAVATVSSRVDDVYEQLPPRH